MKELAVAKQNERLQHKHAEQEGERCVCVCVYAVCVCAMYEVEEWAKGLCVPESTELGLNVSETVKDNEERSGVSVRVCVTASCWGSNRMPADTINTD